MTGAFGWSKRRENPSEAFVNSLPPGPLRAHLGNLHSLYLNSLNMLPEPVGPNAPFPTDRQKDNMLQVYEHSLRSIARFTMTPPHANYERDDKLASKGVRRQFKKITDKEKP